jgi:hypothetical protein
MTVVEKFHDLIPAAARKNWYGYYARGSTYGISYKVQDPFFSKMTGQNEQILPVLQKCLYSLVRRLKMTADNGYILFFTAAGVWLDYPAQTALVIPYEVRRIGEVNTLGHPAWRAIKSNRTSRNMTTSEAYAIMISQLAWHLYLHQLSIVLEIDSKTFEIDVNF